MTVQEQAFEQVQGLVRKFKNMPARERREMNEMATRLGYILPLFHSLGWDIADPHEVSPEEKVSRGFVDFSFRLGGVPRFFLETKRASEDLNDPRWAQQAMDYAWTKSVTWALLSDFEGLRVFNAEWKESNPFKAQFIDFDLDRYISDFERLWWLSRPATAEGRLDKEAEAVGKRSKRTPVSQALFDDLKTWRVDLFKDMHGFNPLWSPAQIDEAVLRLLNRLIFIRTAEDRQVEEPRLRALVRDLKNQKRFQSLDKELARLFRELDAVYNSELFAPHFSEGLEVTPTTLEEVIEGLYEKGFVRYNFNALEADVLGTVYEQYLGSMVAQETVETQPLETQHAASLPPKGEALTVQERRKKRKSQGIYYTPAFVTKYIVGQTVGRWLEEHGYNPSKPPRVLDMACGSGSFLIEAFDAIDGYVARQRHQEHGGEVDIQDYARQVEVLSNCIYGVDKDKQAVEVARLNLLLRALHSREKLPMLENIHCGDSLRPETWERAFPEVMGEGGFDVIIGNPPYVRQETLGAEFKEFAQANFETYAGTADLYIYFIEKAHKLLKPGGTFGMIVSNKWMRSNYGKALRDFLKRESKLEQIIDFGELPVFGDVLAYPLILITRRDSNVKQHFIYASIKNLDFNSLQEELTSTKSEFDDRSIQGFTWTLSDNEENRVLNKIKGTAIPLSEYVNGKIFRGLITGYNKAFVINDRTRDELISEDIKSDKLIKSFLIGRDVHEYYYNFNNTYLIRIPKGWTNQEKGKDDDPWTWFMENYPSLAYYLSQFEAEARKRQDKGDYWWELRACDYYSEFEKPKIIFPSIVNNASFTYDELGHYSNDKTCVIPISDLYLLGVLNSTISDFILNRVASTKQGGYFEQKPMYVGQIPIHQINFDNPAEKAAHDNIVSRVEQILGLHKERQALDPAAHFDEIRELERRIQRLDGEIDRLVYGLYGLTEEEIRIVEGG